MHYLERTRKIISVILVLLVAVSLMSNVNVAKVYADEAVLSATLSISATKEVVNEDGESQDISEYDGEFTFELKDSDGNVLQTVNNNGNKIVFDSVEISKAGSYTYVISEVRGDRDDLSYADEEKSINIIATEETVSGKTRVVLSGDDLETVKSGNEGQSITKTSGGSVKTGNFASENIDTIRIIKTSDGLVAYCLNEDRPWPSEYNGGTKYDLVGGNGSVWNYSEKEGSANNAAELEENLEIIGYYGYPNDGSGEILNWIKDTFSKSDDAAEELFQMGTQVAVYSLINGSNNIFEKVSNGEYKLRGDRNDVARKIFSYGDVPATAKVSLYVYESADSNVDRQNLLGFSVEEKVVDISSAEYAVSTGTFVNALIPKEEEKPTPEEPAPEKEDEPTPETPEETPELPSTGLDIPTPELTTEIETPDEPTPETPEETPELPSTGLDIPTPELTTEIETPDEPTPETPEETPELPSTGLDIPTPELTTEIETQKAPAPKTPTTEVKEPPVNVPSTQPPTYSAPKTGDETNPIIYATGIIVTAGLMLGIKMLRKRVK